jgi:hypothetical protein
MTEGDKKSLNALQAEIATRPLQKRHSQNHVYSFLCGHFIGQRTTEQTRGRDNAEKEKTNYGQVEHRVQGKVMATEILSILAFVYSCRSRHSPRRVDNKLHLHSYVYTFAVAGRG